MQITLLCSNKNHPIHPYLQKWKARSSFQHNITIVSEKSKAKGGDILFLVSCNEIIRKDVRSLYKSCLVIHASDLPLGRGWSPHIWELSTGAEGICLCLLEAEDCIDSGKIWKKDYILIPSHCDWKEINHLLFNAEINLINYAIDELTQIKPMDQNKTYAPTYFRRRTPEDSEIDPNKSISEQFNKIRVCDPNRFPAFFYYLGFRYKITMEKLSD